MPAGLGLTAATAPAGSLQQANALLAVTGDVTGIAGPLIAGGLTVTVGAGWALVVDGVSFLGSALLLSGLRLPPLARKPTSFLTEVRGGWREVTKRSWVWASILYFALFNMAFAVIVVLGPARLAGTANGALGWGAIMAGLSVGTLTGNALALRLSPHYLLRWPRIAALLAVPMIVALAFGAPVPVLIVTAFFLGTPMRSRTRCGSPRCSRRSPRRRSRGCRRSTSSGRSRCDRSGTRWPPCSSPSGRRPRCWRSRASSSRPRSCRCWRRAYAT